MTEEKRTGYVTRNNTGSITRINNSIGIHPIYPVRYAYANFFETRLAEANPPPSLSTLLNATTVNQGKGYVVRLLREGWVYVREEDNEENGFLHIFKYEKVESNGKLYERFKKFLFKNRINAQGGLKEDATGRPGNSYPFVFVRRGIQIISIAYSEHEWSADVIDRINGSSKERKSCMQQVDLSSDSAHSIQASPENLSKLVEDYKKRKDRLLQLSTSTENPEVENVGLDVLTTESSYDLSAEEIAEELQEKSVYGEVARIVALHDPVGRQKEIAMAHAKLSVWEKDYASVNMYPFVIGNLIKDFRNASDEDIREVANESINWQEHEKYWKEIAEDFDTFQQRQQEFADLYKSFMFGQANMGKVGSLDTYFRKFFCQTPADDEAAELELKKLCEVSSGMFEGILASEKGAQAMEEVLSNAAEETRSIENSKNVYHIVFELLRGIVTTPQSAFDWSIGSIKAIDTLLLGLGSLWGKIVAAYKYGAEVTKKIFHKATFNSLKYITKDLVPLILRVFGLRLTGNKVTLSNRELDKILGKLLSQQLKGQKLTAIDDALRKMKRGQQLFDWTERVKTKKLPVLWELSEVEVERAAGKRYSFVIPETRAQKIGLIFDSGFAGLSAFFNIMSIAELNNQTNFSYANPLARGSRIQSSFQFTSSIASLTLDTVLLARSATLVTGSLTARSSSSLARAIAPHIRGGAGHLGRFLASKIATRLIIVANFAAAVSSIWDSYRSFSAGNTGEGVGHVLLAIGSGVLFAQAMVSLAAAAGGAAAASSATVVGLPVGVVVGIVALLFMGVGLALVLYYGKSPFTLLLENCFWGNGSKYAFWSQFSDPRPKIDLRLRRAEDMHSDIEIQNAYRMEYQEFMNFLCMPKLTIDIDAPFAANLRGAPRTYKYTFELPNFQEGVSELHYTVFTATINEFGMMVPTYNAAITKKLSDILKGSDIRTNNGIAEIEISLETPTRTLLKWAYEPQPGVMVPHRMLDKNGELKAVAFGMMDENPR